MESLLQPVLDQGLDGVLDVMRLILNESMRIERAKFLRADNYERTTERNGYANGYKPKTLNTRLGAMTVNVPQTRDCDFYPSCLEKGLRSERALTAAMMEMYVQGVSTRKVNAVLEELCGLEVSSSQVSRVNKLMDEEIEAWRNRRLGRMDYLLLDARYEKVRTDGVVRDCALLTAYGVDDKGKRTVLGVSVEMSEAEIHWRNFLESLVSRGLHGLKMITSDNHSGLKAARMAVFPSVPWQRCQFHLQQNASAYIPKKTMREDVHAKIKNIFNAPDQLEAERLLKISAELYRENASDLAAWMEENITDGLTVFSNKELNTSQQKKLRTTNMVEFQNKELKKRTRIIRVFPNKNSLLRIAASMLIELDEKWQTESKAYIAKGQ